MRELKKGFQGPEYYRWYDWAFKYAASYNFLLGKRDGYFGTQEDAFVREMQRRLGNMVIDGIFGDRMAAKVGYIWGGDAKPPVVAARRKIWIWTSPGSGATGDVGPSHDLGDRCRDILKLNHQWVYFQKGGYLGFLGGDPTFSYVEVTWDQCKSIEWLWDNNSDVQEAMQKGAELANTMFPRVGVNNLADDQLLAIAKQLVFEGHLSGYSQSADGTEDALEWLCGDPGFVHPGDATRTPSVAPYRLIRHCIKLVVQFGNPSTKGTGIARKVRPAWLDAKIRNVNYDNDFYAVALDNIRPAFYAIIVEADMSLPFFVHVMKIGLKVMTPLVSVFGGILGPLGPIIVAGMTGLGALTPLLGGLMGQASASDEKVDADLEKMLSVTGLINDVPDIIGLIGALPGLQAHGNYPFDPVMMDKAFAFIASFKR